MTFISLLVSRILVFDVFLDLCDRHSLIVHFAGVERDVLTQVTTRTMLVLEAEEIVLVAEAGHASAEAGQLFQNLGNVFGGLISGASLLVCKQRRRQYVSCQGNFCRIIRALGGST